MTSLTLDLPTELVERLQRAAERAGQPIHALVAELLTEQLKISYRHPDVVPAPPGERERARAALRAAGLRGELGTEMQRLAAESTGTVEEVEAAFARAGGQPLSELVLAMRGPKV